MATTSPLHTRPPTTCAGVVVMCLCIACGSRATKREPTPPLPEMGAPLACDATPNDEARGTLLTGVEFQTSPQLAGDHGIVVTPTACGQVVVAYAARLSASETSVHFAQVELLGTPAVTPLASSGGIHGWVNDCAARADGSWACAGGLGYRYGPLEGGWVDLFDAAGEAVWSQRDTSRDAAEFPVSVAAADDGSLVVASHHDGSTRGALLERTAREQDQSWRVELEALDSEAELVDAGPVVAVGDGVVTAGGEMVGGWWRPWLAHHDASGEVLWQVSLAGKPELDVLVHDMVVLPSGVSAVAAGFGGVGTGSADSHAGTGVLTAISNEGDELWSIEAETGESIEALLVDTDGNLLTLGTYPIVELVGMCEPEELSCEERALVLRTFDGAGNELWSKRYELLANEPPRFRQPSLLSGAWLGGKLVVVGWNYDGAQPWLGTIAY